MKTSPSHRDKKEARTLEEQRKDAANQIAETRNVDVTKVHICMADDMHPYNCDGMFGGSCIHCEEKIEEGHNPKTCALCNWDSDLPR